MAAEKRLEYLLSLIMNGASRVLDADVSSIFLCDYTHNELYSRFIQQAHINEIRFPIDKGIAGDVVKTKQTVNIKDAYQDPRFNPDIDRQTQYQTQSLLCMPLISRQGQVIGVTQVLNKKEGAFSAYDEELLAMFSLQATICIENTLLAEEQKRLFKSLIHTLSKTIDARDPITAGHSQRVALYAVRLARACHLDDQTVNEVEVASFLHDIGKLGVRDNILLKPGTLTSEEYKQVKEHAAYTNQILEQVHFSEELKKVPFLASVHHERIDGKGYPYGLAGEDLPLPARIISIADVFDAITAYDRPYKQVMSLDKAIGVLEKGKGTQFDAELVDLFIKERCYNIERRQFQRVSVNLKFEIVFLSYDDQINYWGKLMGGQAPENRPPVEACEESGLPEVFGEKLGIRVDDISEGGMQFETGYYFPVDNLVIMEIHVKSVCLSVLSKVVRVRPRPIGRYLMGVEFVTMKMDERRKLLHYIHSLSQTEKQTLIRLY